MVFEIFNKKQKEEKKYDYFVCRCGHFDLQHDVLHDSIDHRLPIDVQIKHPCTSCECPQYIFQIKTNLDGWFNVLRERREQWRIKQENWDKDIDKEIGI